MNYLNLKVEIDPGTDIENALIESCMLSSHIKCSIMFDFNGVNVRVLPNYKVDIDKRIKEGIEKYHETAKLKMFKIMCI